MTGSLEPERCQVCGRVVPQQWSPPVLCGGRALPGTGQWRSQLEDDCCPRCSRVRQERLRRTARRLAVERRLALLMGGERAAQEFTLERFSTAPGNRLAFERARAFRPDRDNLYLLGACGVGKTHLAYAIARRGLESGRSVILLKASELVRTLRMREPDEEERILAQLARSEILVVDDLGIGSETPFFRQVFQEVLDRRHCGGRSGLVVTSKFSLDQLAEKLGDDSIPSRLAGLCAIVTVEGPDRRVAALEPHVGRGARRPT